MQVATLAVMAMIWATNMVQSSAPALRSRTLRVYRRRKNTTDEIAVNVAVRAITSSDLDSNSLIDDMVAVGVSGVPTDVAYIESSEEGEKEKGDNNNDDDGGDDDNDDDDNTSDHDSEGDGEEATVSPRRDS